MRFIVIPLALLSACAVDDGSTRPKTVEYLTDAILLPSCAPAQCHSSFARKEGLSFSTVDEARPGITDMVAGAIDSPTHGTPDASQFVQVLTRNVDRMPFDQALSNADQQLIRDFISLGAPGAQCNPDNGEMQCLGSTTKLISCGADFNATVIEDCGLRTPETGMEWKCIAGQCESVDLP